MDVCIGLGEVEIGQGRRICGVVDKVMSRGK